MNHSTILARLHSLLSADPRIAGYSLDGSFGSPLFDEFSDIDVIVAVFPEHIEKILTERYLFMAELGELLSVHDHRYDKRLAIGLYNMPPRLLHIDVKWVPLSEYIYNVKTPTVIWEHNNLLTNLLAHNDHALPPPDFQQIENMVWTWMHYALAKIGRGEILEAADYLAEARLYALAPLLQYHNGSKNSRWRRAEQQLPPDVLAAARLCFCDNTAADCLRAVRAFMDLYSQTRDAMGLAGLQKKEAAQKACYQYWDYIKSLH